MKTTPFLLTLSALAVCAPLGFAQSTDAPRNSVKHPSNGILGYLDPKTGAFRALAQGASDVTSATTTATGGKLVFNLTINVESAIPTSTPISCTASASTDEVNTTTYASSMFYEYASATATRSGTTAKCTVTIPYSWLLATPTSDTIALSVIISAESTSAVLRESDQTVAIIKVPANGATTTETLTATF